MDSNTNHIGKAAKNFRKGRIKDLLSVVKGNRGWREAFCEKHPAFNNHEGFRIISRATGGTSDDVELLKALEEFIPFIQETQPEWYKKQKPTPEPVTV